MYTTYTDTTQPYVRHRRTVGRITKCLGWRCERDNVGVREGQNLSSVPTLNDHDISLSGVTTRKDFSSTIIPKPDTSTYRIISVSKQDSKFIGMPWKLESNECQLKAKIASR